MLVRKSRRALVREGLGALVVCGGVAANRGLRAALAEAAREDGFALYIPPPKRCTDNAADDRGGGDAAATSAACTRGLDLAVDPGLPSRCRRRSDDPRRVLARHGLAREEVVGAELSP